MECKERTPPGFTDSEWKAVLDFINRHSDENGNCDIEAMNVEAAENWRRYLTHRRKA